MIVPANVAKLLTIKFHHTPPTKKNLPIRMEFFLAGRQTLQSW